MKNRVVIIPIGHSGNLKSVERALLQVGAEISYYEENFNFDSIDKIVLPGVGNFKDAMDFLSKSLNKIKNAIQKKPTLGICLGMQILSMIGYENGIHEGLGLIDGEVVEMRVNAKTPHLGWNKLINIKNNPLFKGIKENESFYFMHSYELVNYTDFISLTKYNNHNFVSAIKMNNIFGVQFHPEKSGISGLTLLKNFIEMEDEDV